MNADPDLDAIIDEQVDESERILAFAEEALVGKPVEWGEDDCSTFPAKYLASRGVPIEIPAYGSEAEAQAVVERYGTLADVWTAIADRSGLREVPIEMRRAGDVGVIRVSTLGQSHGGQIGGIFLKYGLLLLIRTEDGARMISPREATIVKVWRRS